VKYFNLIAAILLTLLYLTGKIPPTERYNLWFTIFIIPFAMVANTVLLIVAAIMRRKSALFYVVPMVVGIPYFIGTIGIKSYFNTRTPEDTFTLLSYNVSNFTIKSSTNDDIPKARQALHDMILQPDTDIQCYQEFVNYSRSSQKNIISKLTNLKRHFYFSMEPETDQAAYSRVGTLIVSRFPIVASGDILASDNGFNRVSFVDVVVRGDTVRIINVHLFSMGLGQYDPRTRSQLNEVRQATRTILSKLKEGVFERSKQVSALARFVENSPYPVVCAGDFNDMPYAYSYQYLRGYMKNAFEQSGKGFGFTYNGGTLRVLRIDNQFYRGPIRSFDFQTRYDLPYTDHFPVEGTYQLDVKR
jgi:endonuclease/exonuclease/phosphatase family metal-dependent hydrolase